MSFVQEDVAFEINELATTNVDKNVQSDTTKRAEKISEKKNNTKIDLVFKPAREFCGKADANIALSRKKHIVSEVFKALKSCQYSLRLTIDEQYSQSTISEHIERRRYTSGK